MNFDSLLITDTFNNYDLNNPNGITNKISIIEYTDLLKELENGNVKSIDFYNNSKNAVVETTSSLNGNIITKKQSVEIANKNLSSLISKLKAENVDINAYPTKTSSIKTISDIIQSIIPPLAIVALVFYFWRARRPGTTRSPQNQIFNLRKLKADFKTEDQTGVTFDDVAGIDEVKNEFEEIVAFLKNPAQYTKVGAKIPKGILLVGPPGTGKTLLAKAIAGQADVPFLNTSGSEFVEMFVGVGAARVRDLFERAKQNSPCIIFIDEIDSIGRKRGVGVGPGNDEREQTLNQLLTEMDGFEKNQGVIIIGATNRADVLDDALLRPGRFTRQVSVNLPDKTGREEILKIYLKNKKLSLDLSITQIAQRTVGFSGADLANLINEAAILAVRNGKKLITPTEVNTSLERIIAGIEGPPINDNKNKRLIAYHEAGHAIVGSLLENHDYVENVTLIPRGQARGLTWFTPNVDNLIGREQIIARIIGALGGRAAEQIVFGDAEITTGASGDFVQSTDMARQMVLKFGMSSLGPKILPNANRGSLFMGRGVRMIDDYSTNLGIKLDIQTKRIINLCYSEAISIMSLNRLSLDLVVKKLIGTEFLTGIEFEKTISNLSRFPAKSEYTSKIQIK